MTTTVAIPSIQVRPQPVGIYSFPVSFLLLPETEDQTALAALMSGDAKAPVADDWQFYTLAIEGCLEEARQAIHGNTLIDEWNRFVLQPGNAEYLLLLQKLPENLVPLLQAAAYAVGLAEEVVPEAESLDAELRATVLFTAASWYLEKANTEKATALLEDAFTLSCEASPLLAAQILNQIAAVKQETSPATAITRYQEAIQLAGDTPLASLRAELWLNLGIAWQSSAEERRWPLLEAAKAYQEAIRCGLSLEYLPELYALAQCNLALVYLTLPALGASDQLRMGIAVQGLREALKVYRRETHPEMWSSAQLNLANALQYMPSSHQEENLQQSVELYEELLEVRNKALDPLAYARLLANQANALAHLGIFQPALEKLSEAHKLFHWHGEPDMAASALELTDEINRNIEEARR
jgi:tetratricopeptide (TPR) repeat protein